VIIGREPYGRTGPFSAVPSLDRSRAECAGGGHWASVLRLRDAGEIRINASEFQARVSVVLLFRRNLVSIVSGDVAERGTCALRRRTHQQIHSRIFVAIIPGMISFCRPEAVRGVPTPVQRS